MKLNEIKELIKTIDDSEINELEIKQDGFKIKLSKEKQVVNSVIQPQPQLQEPIQPAKQAVDTSDAVATTDENNNHNDIENLPEDMYLVKSPIVGTFYESPSPDSESYVKVGDKVSKGDVLCIVEAMKIMNEIKTDVDGKVYEILVEDEDIVEYDQPLMIIRR